MLSDHWQEIGEINGNDRVGVVVSAAERKDPRVGEMQERVSGLARGNSSNDNLSAWKKPKNFSLSIY